VNVQSKIESIVRPKSHRSISLHSRSSKRQDNIVRDIYPESDLDNGIVGWEGQDDPMHPRCVSAVSLSSDRVDCGTETIPTHGSGLF
jgi:hypothetical protein